MNHDPIQTPADDLAGIITQLLNGTSTLGPGDITVVAVGPTDVDQTNFQAVDGNRATTEQVALAAGKGLGSTISTRTAYGIMVQHGEPGSHLIGIRVDDRVWVQTADRSGRVTSSIEQGDLAVDRAPRSEWSEFQRRAGKLLVGDTAWETLVGIAKDQSSKDP